MSATRNAQSGEAATGGFSYAQAAKGRSLSTPMAKASSSAASGATTPASNSISEVAVSSNWADDGETLPTTPSSPHKTDHSSSATAKSTQRQEKTASDDAAASSRVNGAKEKSDAHDALEKSGSHTTRAGDVDGTGEDPSTDSPSEEKQPAKPVFHEAKPPVVNIWAQRAAEAKAKAVSSPPATATLTSQPKNSADTDRSRVDPRRKSDQGSLRDSKKVEHTNRPREDARKPRKDGRPEETSDAARKSGTKLRDRANSEAPPPTTGISWPKPTDVLDERKGDDKEKPSQAQAAAKTHGKTEWTRMPYTPTAVFETRIEGKGAGRMGKGMPRTGQATSGRGPHPAIPKSSSPSGGEHPSAPAANKSDRETSKDESNTSPTTATNDAAATKAPHTNGVANPGTDIVAEPLPDKNDSGDLKSKLSSTSPSNAPPKSNGSVHEANPAVAPFVPASELNNGAPDHKAAGTERRNDAAYVDNRDGQLAFRESRRGGRKLNRGGFINTGFGGHNSFANGAQDHQFNQFTPMSPSSPQFHGRGGSNQRGYRAGPRSQSIPFEPYGRQGNFNGHPMMPMQPFVPEFYGGPYPAGPFLPPGQDYPTAHVQSQIEYYFSIDNLVKDMFLRKHMDSQGWIPLTVIAAFRRMTQISTDYGVIRSACLNSMDIEIRVADDGKDRLRKVQGWEQWILPMEDRDPAARNDGPTNLRRPSPPRQPYFDPHMNYPTSPGAAPQFGRGSVHSFNVQDGASAPFYPGTFDPRFNDFSGNGEEPRGRQIRPSHRDIHPDPLANGFSSEPGNPSNDESDRFQSSQIEGLTVVVRKHDGSASRPAPHNASARTFSNGSIDSHGIMEEVGKFSEGQTNGVSTSNIDSASVQSPEGGYANALTLFWVKDKETPVDAYGLPADTTHELYTYLRSKALAQRDAAATGTCPYDLDVLYQFWSHFLIRNFNSQMYNEFKILAAEDLSQRHNNVGMTNLVKYYSEACASQITIRENVAHDLAELIQTKGSRNEGPAFTQLRQAWKDGLINLKNRKKLGDFLSESSKGELDA